MMNSGSAERITSSDIERRRKALKARIYDYKKKGYNVSRFTDFIEGDISVAEEAFIDFLNDVHILEEMEDRFYRLDTKGFEQETEEIEAMLRDPDRIRELERAIVSLEEKIRRRKSETESRIDAPTSEEELRSELEKIREEELHRIREEETDRMREQERKRILQEELDRIRKEEEEKLRKTELEKIRNEERERLVWEERVMRQLRHIKEKPKEKKQIKKVKCPACGADIPVTSSKRPLKIRCPECGRNYTLKAKEELKENGKKPEPKVKYKKCPKCGAPIPIVSDKRPLKIICQTCGAEYILKGKKGEANGVKKTVKKGAISPLSPESLTNPRLPLKSTPNPALEVKSYGEEMSINSTETITCPTCGREIPADAKICGYCGTPIEEEDRKAALEKKRTQNQGKGNTIICPNCGNEIPADAKICGYCGQPIQKEESAQATPPMDDFELPSSATDIEKESIGDKTKFKPLNEYDLQNEPELPPVEPIKPQNKPASTSTESGGDSKSPDMVVCPKCGNLVPRGAKFCGVCGNPM